MANGPLWMPCQPLPSLLLQYIWKHLKVDHFHGAIPLSISIPKPSPSLPGDMGPLVMCKCSAWNGAFTQ